jgi:hypothetical protein
MVQLHFPGLAGFLLRRTVDRSRGVRGLARRARSVVLRDGSPGMVNSAANPRCRTALRFQLPVLAHFDAHGRPYRYAYVADNYGQGNGDTCIF